MRAHPVVGDTLIAGLIGIPDLLSTVANLGGTPRGVYLLVGLFLWGPLIFRRARPKLTSNIILVAAFVQLVTHNVTHGEYGIMEGVPVRPADFALGIALYTMVAYVGRRQGLIYAAWLLLGTVLWEVWRIQDPPEVAISFFMVVCIFGFCWAVGEFVGARRALNAELLERLKLLEVERDQQARIAVADERTRIARELHDVVAHAVSVMVVQADGAAYALQSDPQMAQLALSTISDTGRQALGELRRLLGLMRNESDSETDRLPQPDTSSLPQLAEQVRTAGLPVSLTLRGDLGDLPAGVGLSVYRIVQEALTNSLKHAGGSASADVFVTRAEDRIDVVVDDNGFGTPRELAGMSGGNGLIGMRERAGVLGGSLEAGPRPGGGWRVHAVLPVGAAQGPLV
ncbi:sensor histidine kinase [Kutzneria buriramensis]|uniref:histidine kinase n=1 Tax=Kutzneria buriramensis TaxID=1045776 RepID=A0A3E0HU54_9PSEU|nr:histidine kinase [Kutzneria buriramensis]REH49786.1 histidine kinase [Kutzneria buriramensis]